MAAIAVAPFAVTLSVTACGQPQAEQCRAVVSAVERALRSRIAPDGAKLSEDEMLASQSALAHLPVTIAELERIRDNAARDQDDITRALHALDRAQVYRDVTEAQGRLAIATKREADNLAALQSFCGRVARPSSTAPPSAVVAPDAWMHFRHPQLPFEADFFRAPDVGQRRERESVTDAAMADDGSRRMFSAAHVSFPDPPTRNCAVLLDAWLDTQSKGCRTTRRTSMTADDLPAVEVLRSCDDGAVVLERVRCAAGSGGQPATLFDAQSIYLSEYDDVEARRFVDSARLVSP